MAYPELRKGRYSQSGRGYFITTVTHGRNAFFSDIYNARQLILTMRQLHNEGHVESLSWVVMPDHLHWLFMLGQQSSLSDLVKSLKGRSARRINLRLKRQGAIWQKAYHDHGIRDGEDLLGLARYIVANPLRAGLTNKIEQYSHWDAVWL